MWFPESRCAGSHSSFPAHSPRARCRAAQDARRLSRSRDWTARAVQADARAAAVEPAAPFKGDALGAAQAPSPWAGRTFPNRAATSNRALLFPRPTVARATTTPGTSARAPAVVGAIVVPPPPSTRIDSVSCGASICLRLFASRPQIKFSLLCRQHPFARSSSASTTFSTHTVPLAFSVGQPPADLHHWVARWNARSGHQPPLRPLIQAAARSIPSRNSDG